MSPSARRVRRIALGVLIAAAALELAYVAIMLVLLNTGLLGKWVNDSQDDIDFDASFGWSPWPGRVYSRGLSLVGHDSHVEWQLTVERGWMKHELLPLFRRELRATGGGGRGVVFRLRKTRAAKELCEAKASALPHIPGLFAPLPHDADAKTRKDCEADAEGVPARQPDQGTSTYWIAHLSNLEAEEIREVWIEDYRFLGQARANGGFYLFPTRRVELEPSESQIYSGELWRGDQMLMADHIQGESTLRLDEVLVPELDQGKIFHYVSGRGRLEAHVGGPGFFNSYLTSTRWLRFIGGDGRLEADYDVQRGIIREGTRVDLASSKLAARVWEDEASGSGHATFAVESVQGRPLGRLKLLLDRWQSKRHGAKKAYVKGSKLSATVVTHDLDLVDPFRHLDMRVEVPSGLVSDFRDYDSYIPRGAELAIRSGTATVSASLHITERDRLEDGVFFLTGRDLGFTFRTLNIRGDLDVDARFESDDLKKARLDLGGTVARIRNASVVGKDGDVVRAWTGTLTVQRAFVTPQKDILLDGTFEAKLSDVRPLLAIYETENPLPFPVKSVLDVDNVSGTLQLIAGKDLLGARDVNIHGRGGLALQACAQITPSHKRAALLLSWAALALSVDVVDGNKSVHLFNATDDYKRSAKEIARALEARGTRTGTIAP